MVATRREILRHMLHHKEGLTVEELSELLGISRNAVQQHLLTLERDALVNVVEQRRTGGRPSRVYALSDRGYESFPRRYALLARRLLEAAREALGEQGLDTLLKRVAADLAGELAPRLQQLPPGDRLRAVMEIMNELGYEASPAPEGTGPGIAAANCIFHQLARETRAVCRFDVELLSRLLGSELHQVACMADGHPSCIFRTASPGCAAATATRSRSAS